MNETDRRRRLVSPTRRQENLFATRRRAWESGSVAQTSNQSPEDFGMDSIWEWNKDSDIEKGNKGREVVNGES